MPYYSPSVSSSLSGGASVTRQQRARRARQSPALNAWIAARKRAADELQNKYKAAVVAGQPVKTRSAGKGKRRMVVPASQVNELARQYYRQAGFEPKGTQTTAARSKRVHGLSTKDLHRPMTVEEGMNLFLQGYAAQATEGHRVNPTGTRKYPRTGAVAERISPELRGQTIPKRTTKSFTNPAEALRRRMTRVAGVSPVDGKVHGRRVVNLCPDEAADPKTGRVSLKKAKALGCADSWKLRRRGAWRNYQVPGVTQFSTPSEARKSPLYRRAKKQLPKGDRKKVDPVWLQPYQRRKGQSPAAWKARVSPMRQAAARQRAARQAGLPYGQVTPVTPSQTPSDFDVDSLEFSA